jgi:hypothetical protein
MRHFRFLPLAVLAASFCAYGSVDAGLLALVPSGAKVVGSIDVTTCRDSELGQFLLAKSSQAQDPHFLKLMEETGFDPRRDLQSLVFAGSATQGSQSAFAILARGTFDERRIRAHAQAQGASFETYQGVEMILNLHQGEPTALAFLDVGVAVVADATTLRQIIAGRAAATVLPQALRGRIEALGSADDLWFVSLMSGDFLSKHLGVETGEGEPLAQQGKAVQSIIQSSGGVRLGSTINVTFHAITRSPQDANSLADVIHFLASMVQMQRQNDARADLVASSLDSMVVQTEGDAVHFSMSMPEKNAEQLADLAPQPNSHHRAKPSIQ